MLLTIIMRIIKILKTKKKSVNVILLFIYIFILFPALINLKTMQYQLNSYQDQYIKSSGIWATLDLTNPTGINESRFSHNTIISVQGRLFNRINDTGKQGYTVAIEVDDVVYPSINDITDFNGDFQINYTIDPSLNIYLSHKIEANVLSPPNTVEYRTYYVIDVNTTSCFNINEPSTPKLIGEDFLLNGYLRCDNVNGTGISNAQINYYWYNSSYNWSSSSFFTSPIDGSISQSISIPIDAFCEKLYLNLSYSGDSPYTSSTQKNISINLFWDINCEWNTIPSASEGDKIIINGQLSSKINNALKIYNRTIDIYYDGNYINSTNTDTNGNFSYAYTIPTGTGNKSIQIKLINSVGLSLSSFYFINITKITIPPSDPNDTETPYLGFLLIFLPIIIGIVVGLSAYGYYRYKKQDKESRIVYLPLESKIINLKILKDTGRLEESLSYLFNAIYMDLINAKFGRTRSDNETIRDFAIISVKNLKLSPTTIYPFIQKVEEIIYAKPFQITDKEFYNTINLFSPIYFELTGYNFVLNF